MDVGLDLGDVADLHVLPGRGHDLHDADRADGTSGAVVQRRLLVSLRRHQQVIEVVLLAVLLEQLDHSLELLAFCVGRGVFHVLNALEISTFKDIADGVALAVLLQRLIDDVAELRILLAKCHGQRTAGSHGDVRDAP